MRRLLALLFAVLLLTACASSAPSLVAGAEVTFDRCGQPVVLTRVDGVPAGGDWRADTTVTVYRPCNTATPEAPDAPTPTPQARMRPGRRRRRTPRLASLGSRRSATTAGRGL